MLQAQALFPFGDIDTPSFQLSGREVARQFVPEPHAAGLLVFAALAPGAGLARRRQEPART